MASSIYLVTPITKARYIPTEFLHPTSRYFITPIEKAKYFVTIPYVTTSRYFVTPIQKARYFNIIPFETLDFNNNCKYPKELDLIRQKATLLIWDIIKTCLNSSIYQEEYGKESLGGYNKAGILRLLLDYLSSIWMEKDNDSRSGLARTSDYYWTTYKIYDIIYSFKKCDLNIKSIVALFNLNSYTVKDDEWPNYFMMNNVIYPPDENKQKQMKQWTDIYTLQNMTPDRNQSIRSISASQTSFIPTKNIKYFSVFTINGVDYTGYTDYNANSVTYSPSIAFGYNIESSDTVVITYWYEE